MKFYPQDVKQVEPFKNNRGLHEVQIWDLSIQVAHDTIHGLHKMDY